MNELRIVREAIESGHKYLVLAGDQVFIAKEGAEFFCAGRPTFDAAIVVPLDYMLLTFESLTQTAKFKLARIATLADVASATACQWDASGILPPSLHRPTRRGDARVYSRADAFAAMILGTLKRKKASDVAMTKVAKWIRGIEPIEVANGADRG